MVTVTSTLLATMSVVAAGLPHSLPAMATATLIQLWIKWL
jgi:hypothetical protein